MVSTAGLTLTEAEHAIEDAHPGWHVWHSRDGKNPGRIYATSTARDDNPECSGTTLDAPSVERIEEAIGTWEHEHDRADGAAA